MDNEIFSFNFYESFGCKTKEELYTLILSDNKKTSIISDFISFYKKDIKDASKTTITSPEDAINYIQSLKTLKEDEITIVCVDTKNSPIHIFKLKETDNNYKAIVKEMLDFKSMGYFSFYNTDIKPDILVSLKSKAGELFEELDSFKYDIVNKKIFSSLGQTAYPFKFTTTETKKESLIKPDLISPDFDRLKPFVGSKEYDDFFDFYFREQSVGLNIDNKEELIKESLKLKTQFFDTEMFGCILYNDKNEILDTKDLFKGGFNKSIVDHRVLFSYILSNTDVKGFSVYHNHPSGNLTPSKNDVEVTKYIKNIAKGLNIEFKDHYISSKLGVFSFRDSLYGPPRIENIYTLEPEPESFCECKTFANGDKEWYKEGKLHRDNDLPAIERANGYKAWFKNGKEHREGDKPAVERANGTKEWWINGKLHRDGDKPALEFENGTKQWYKNGEIHRDGDLPAAEWADGDRIWCKNGKIHRDGDKPAVEKANGTKEWWINGDMYRDNTVVLSLKEKLKGITNSQELLKKTNAFVKDLEPKRKQSFIENIKAENINSSKDFVKYLKNLNKTNNKSQNKNVSKDYQEMSR